MANQYYLFNTTTRRYTFTDYFEVQPSNSVDFPPRINCDFALLNQDSTEWIDCRSESEINDSKLALYFAYPEYENIFYKSIPLDNLEMIERVAPISNKGLKGEKNIIKMDY